jgi:hypothetical protein
VWCVVFVLFSKVFEKYGGSYVRQFGSRGEGNGALQYPNSIAIDGPYAYVTEKGNHRVQVRKGGIMEMEGGNQERQSRRGVMRQTVMTFHSVPQCRDLSPKQNNKVRVECFCSPVDNLTASVQGRADCAPLLLSPVVVAPH